MVGGVLWIERIIGEWRSCVERWRGGAEGTGKEAVIVGGFGEAGALGVVDAVECLFFPFGPGWKLQPWVV